MHELFESVTGNVPSVTLIALAVALAAVMRVCRAGFRTQTILLLAAPLLLLGLGNLLLPFAVAAWLTGASSAILFLLLVTVILSSRWWAPLGYTLGCLLLLGAGGLFVPPIVDGLVESVRLARGLEPVRPWFLLLLGLLPVIVALSYRSLAGLGSVRRWVAIGLRCLVVILLTLALAELGLRDRNENITVIFVVDRSLSIPDDYEPDTTGNTIGRRWDRLEAFINDAVALRGSRHKQDLAGLILFGRRPRLELPPSNAPSFQFRFKDASAVDGSYTDIAAAIKLALASLPEGTGKRLVLMSDGNENLGNAEEQARLAKLNGVQIDVVPLAAGRRNQNEVLVERVEAPARTEQGARLPIRVLIRSYNTRPVYGILIVRQLSEGELALVAPTPQEVALRPGLNSFSFKQPLVNEQRSYTYEAAFEPKGYLNDKGERMPDLLAGDRPQNNRATTHVVALGQRRVLIVEPAVGDHQLLMRRLQAAGNSKYRVYSVTVDELPQEKEELARFLSSYDCLILANVAASDIEAGDVGEGRQRGVFTADQQEIIRSNTHDQGCGLIMIGGPNGFGAGGWQDTAVEKALPVDCDIRSLKMQGKGGLVLIMHASEMADGNRWQKEIAKLAIKKLSSSDEVGVLHYDFGGHTWHIPLQEIRGKKSMLLALVDRMIPGDMLDFDTPLQMAFKSLMEPARQLATKHVVIISDGDPNLSNFNLLGQMKASKVTVTTVGVATHGPSQDQAMERIAKSTGGRFYKVINPRALPAIYLKESRIVSRSFIDQRRFTPQVLFHEGPAENLPNQLPTLYGYVRTTPKTSALVQVPVVGPEGLESPILAYWHYGLGKSVAFTSDARSQPGKPGWDRDWAESDLYAKFWERVVDWALRPTESGRYHMTAEYSDGKVKVIIDARDESNHPLANLTFQGGVTPSDTKGDNSGQLDLKFEPKGAGIYEAEFKALETGSYFINAQSRRTITVRENGKDVVREVVDSVRGGVTVPYSPEYADLESNTALLEKLREMTGGITFPEEDLPGSRDPGLLGRRTAAAEMIFRAGLPTTKNLRPIWYWLAALAGMVFFVDVAVRRIAIQPSAAVASARKLWSHLRGQASQEPALAPFIERLKNRKAQVEQSLEELHAARRFEPVNPSAPLAPQEVVAKPLPPGPAPSPKKEEPAEDYAARLMKAKQKVWQDREKPPQE